MVAGESARDEAERAERAAAVLERKLAGAQKRARNFAAGADGEQQLAEILAPLTAEGWFFLHDRVNPAGGNIDTIAIGPAGVVVMDAKAWNGNLSVAGDRLKVSGYSKTAQLDKVKGQANAVQAAIENEVEVWCGLVFTTQPGFGPEEAQGVVLTGSDHLLSGVRDMPTILSTAAVERLLRSVSESFGPAGSAPSGISGQKIVESTQPAKYFDRGNQLLYLTSWKAGGRHRIYLKSDSGEQLGYRDVVTGEVHLDPGADHPFAQLVLAAATPVGVTLDRSTIPKVKVDLPAGRLLGTLGKLWTNALIGQVWAGKGKRLLYGTLANPTEGIFKLGYVDLATGWVKPDTTGDLSELLGPADTYLARLRDRMPERGT